MRVAAHQIAGAKPGIALGEDIAQDLLFASRPSWYSPRNRGRRGRRCRPPLRPLRRARIRCKDHRVRAPASRFSTSKRTTRVGSSHSMIIRHPADRADGAVIVQHRDIAFGGAVEFHDAGNGEAVLKASPDFGAQAIAGDGANMVVPLMRAGRRVEQPAAKLADIGEHGGVIFVNVGPEFMQREFALQDHGAAGQERHAHGADPAGGVIERQRIVDAVAGAGRQRADEPRSS